MLPTLGKQASMLPTLGKQASMPMLGARCPCEMRCASLGKQARPVPIGWEGDGGGWKTPRVVEDPPP